MRHAFWTTAVCLCAALACSDSKSSSAPTAGNPGAGAAAPEPARPAPPAPMDPATHEPSDPYARDVYRICHAETLSGAMQLDEGARPVQVAQWLGANVMTDEGRQFLVSIAKAGGPDAKKKVLRTETAKVGLSDCPLVNAWSGDS